MVMVVAAALATVFVYLRGQDLNWDLLNYHYYTGYALLTGRYAHDIAASGMQSFLHPATNVFAYLSLRYLPFPFSAWSTLLVQLASLPAIALIAKEVGRSLGYVKPSLSQVLAVVLCLLSPLWWSELGTSFFSSWIAPVLLWGVYLLVRCFDAPLIQSRSLFMAGVLLGFATGLKLTNAPFAVAAACTLPLLHRGDIRASLRMALVFIIGGVFGALLTAWWYGYLWLEWQSPLFPLYNTIFKSPFYDLKDYRDMRWKFFEFSEFWDYLYQSAVGTVKTSEVRFADARILLISVLLPFAILRRPATKHGRSSSALLIFVGVSFILWARLFAYQRYLIPVELVLGVFAWVLIARIFARESLRVAALASLVVVSAVLLKVPDWGHAKAENGSRNPFSIAIPEQLRTTPARYLVMGAPIGYVLPYLNADSVFYGLNFSRQSERLIAQKLREPSPLPLRVLAEDKDLPGIWRSLARFAITSETHSFNCTYLTTVVSQYSSCELVPGGHTTLADHGEIINAAFGTADIAQKNGVLWEEGFSYQESWGRWSDGRVSVLGFQACLPQGRLRVSITARAFGENIGHPVQFVLGGEQQTAIFDDSFSNTSLYFTNTQECANSLTMRFPAPVIFKRPEPGVDPRYLGLGFTRIQIIKEPQ
uniref:DUF7024 domain-containing protein n=1 Tax=Pseudomonas bambusae TaxID=3139142 RepID=UPI004038E5EC